MSAHRPRLTIGTFLGMQGLLAHQLYLGVTLFAKEHGGIDVRRWDVSRWPQHGLPTSLGLDGIVMQVLPQVKLAALQRSGIPIVNVSTHVRDCPLPRICADEVGMGDAAAGYFLRRGFRNFGYCGHVWHGGSALRFRGFQQAVERAGYHVSTFDLGPLPDEVTSFNFVREHQRHRRWIKSLPRPCAVMCFNDALGAFVIQHCLDEGLRVPQDLAVMGVDNVPYRTHQTPVSISSIEVGFAKIAYEATAELVRYLEGRSDAIPTRNLRTYKIISRRSTDAYAVNDELVAAALDYIDEHRAERLRVSDVLRAVAVSRRVLERRFRLRTGVSIYDVVQNSRLETAKNLLSSTELPLKEVAAAAGFRSAQHLSVAFRAKLRTTPTAYRGDTREQ